MNPAIFLYKCLYLEVFTILKLSYQLKRLVSYHRTSGRSRLYVDCPVITPTNVYLRDTLLLLLIRGQYL